MEVEVGAQKRKSQVARGELEARDVREGQAARPICFLEQSPQASGLRLQNLEHACAPTFTG